MVKKIPVPDSTAEALTERTRDGEVRKDVIERLLEQTAEPTGETDNTEQLAQNAMNVTELQTARSKRMSNAEYLAHTYDVDASEYGSAESLRAAKTEASR